ncbi:cytochrome b N-terminal domain-containing protein [Pseudomonadota bacterium]
MAQNDQRKYFRNLLLHFRPSEVPERTLKLSLTWGLGGMAVVLVFLLIGTGLLLKFAYEPSPLGAYASILYLETQIPFGQLLRNLHRWSGNCLIVISLLHLLRVFYTGAHYRPRQFNWVIGLGLFAVAIFSNFTGYLLPWDQIAYWAVTISTSMLDYLPGAGPVIKQWILGGTEPGPATLMNFYALHTAVLPALLIFVLPFHFWRIRKANGLVVPRSPEEHADMKVQMVDAMPHLIVRELTTAVVLIAALLLFSMFVNAPLAEQANPGLSPNPTKAPWYFMGLQELLMHFHPVFSVFVIPMTLIAGIIALPYFDTETTPAGIWFRSHRGRKLALVAVALGFLMTTASVLLDEFINTTGQAATPNAINNGLLPFAVILALVGGFYLILKVIFKANWTETIQTLFTLLITAFAVLTAIGVWFRGPGMQLMWAG